MIDYTLNDFDAVLEYVAELIGGDFVKAINLANDIIDNSSEYAGPKAMYTALLLAGYRTRIGIAKQFWTLKHTNSKAPRDRLTKDALYVIYDALVEMINSLKLIARWEKDVVGA